MLDSRRRDIGNIAVLQLDFAVVSVVLELGVWFISLFFGLDFRLGCGWSSNRLRNCLFLNRCRLATGGSRSSGSPFCRRCFLVCSELRSLLLRLIDLFLPELLKLTLVLTSSLLPAFLHSSSSHHAVELGALALPDDISRSLLDLLRRLTSNNHSCGLVPRTNRRQQLRPPLLPQVLGNLKHHNTLLLQRSSLKQLPLRFAVGHTERCVVIRGP
mmetsp:Transcript_13946/g.33771  ORF Transcript_13946/g.33771 Transcript_13946/m.33771 type:complete len:214 (-) Transcript_13946:1023-1664(-)